MDRFERKVKGADDDVSPADLRREAAAAAQNQAEEENPVGAPPLVVDNPLPGGGDGPGVVTEYQSLAPQEDMPPHVLSPLDGDDEDDHEEDANAFTSGPDPSSLLLPAVQVVRLDVMEDIASDEPAGEGIAERKAGGGQQEYVQPSDLMSSEHADSGNTYPDSGQAGLVGDEEVWLKSDDPDGALAGDRPLEFIIGDMMPGSGGILDARSPDDTSTPRIGETPLEFKSLAGLEAEIEALDATTGADAAGVALGGPDTTARIVGLPDVANVGVELPETDPLGMTKVDVISEINAEPLAYNQAETLASSFADDDDGDPFDGM